MNSSRLRPLTATLCLITVLMILTACERDSYTTWTCNSATDLKSSMVLRKAQMEFLGMKLSFCGSLGHQSYFDDPCPAAIDQSAVTFTPMSGELVYKNQLYQCKAL